MSQKTAATTTKRLAAVASMIARSLTKMELYILRLVIAVSAADEAVAQPTDGPDEGGLPRVVAELLAQAADQHVGRAGARPGGRSRWPSSPPARRCARGRPPPPALPGGAPPGYGPPARAARTASAGSRPHPAPTRGCGP